jgi:choline dehydrogenase-like flavoprotein
MATRLAETDVVVVGMGAAGGVAVLPLVDAGLQVIGLEAGTHGGAEGESRGADDAGLRQLSD